MRTHAKHRSDRLGSRTMPDAKQNIGRVWPFRGEKRLNSVSIEGGCPPVDPRCTQVLHWDSHVDVKTGKRTGEIPATKVIVHAANQTFFLPERSVTDPCLLVSPHLRQGEEQQLIFWVDPG